ncbi:MAG TPA: DUF6010 family protein [Gemmatimonadales bacterium]|jgi:hypothetical protein
MLYPPILTGAVLGGIFAVVAAQRSPVRELRLLALGLVSAAVIYLGLALVNGNARWLALEAAGVAGFGVVAWLGLRISPWLLALGWTAHVFWDVAFHVDQPQTLIGAWYPLGCVGFDLIVAGALLRLSLRGHSAPA